MKCLDALFAAIVVTVLAGCGGDGGGGTPGTGSDSPVVQVPVGQYDSTTNVARVYVLEDGSFYFANLPASDAYGTLAATGTKVSGSGTAMAFPGDGNRFGVQPTGTWTPQSALSLDFGVAAGGAFNGSFVPGFMAAAPQSDVTGTYLDAANQPAMAVDAAGSFVIDSPLVSPCRITGTIRPHGNLRLYDADLGFNASDQCTQQSDSGIAILEGTSFLFLMKSGYSLHLTKDTAAATPHGRYVNTEPIDGSSYSQAGDTELFVLENGEFWLQHVYRQDGSYIGGNGDYVVHGTLTGSGTNLSGTATQSVFAGDLYTRTLTVTGSYVPGFSIELAGMKGRFQPGFRTAASLSDVAGAWLGPAGQSTTIDASGKVTIDGLGLPECVVTGTLRPRASDKLYDAELTWPGTGPCFSGAMSGVAVPEPNALLFLLRNGSWFVRITRP